MDNNYQENNQQPEIKNNTEFLRNKAQDYLAVDLLDVGKMFLSYWLLLVITAVIGAALGFAYHRYMVPQSYRADASIFIAKTDSVINLSDLQLSSALTVDYQKILTSRGTVNEVIDELALKMDYNKLKSLITVSADDKSHVITITATSDDKALSLKIANAFLNIGIARIKNVIPGSDATIVDYSTGDAVVEVTPSVLRYIGIGALLALAMVMVILFLRYYSDTSLKEEDDVVSHLGLPVLAGVPYYGSNFNMIKDKLDYYQKEAFNSLCGNIMLSGIDVRAVAITSSAPNEGKSSLAFKIAEIMTEFGKKVAYVDCDMRNSTFCARSGMTMDRIKGLSGILSSGENLDGLMFRTKGNERLDVVFAGKNPPSPSALLSSDRFKELVAWLKAHYDYVFFDTPPINLVIDGVFVAKECDGAILVVESGVTDRAQAERAAKELQNGNVNVLGVVINKLYRDRRKYGYGYGRKYGYGKKYGYGYGGKYGYGHKYGYGYGYGYGHGYGVAPETEKKQ